MLHHNWKETINGKKKSFVSIKLMQHKSVALLWVYDLFLHKWLLFQLASLFLFAIFLFFTAGQSKQEADAHGHRPKEKAVEKPEVGSLRRLWESVRAARHHLQLPATVLQTSHPPLDGQKGLLFKGSEHNSFLLNLYVGLQEMCWSLSLTNMRCDLCVRACTLTHACHHSITLCPLCVFCQVYNEVQKQKAEQRMRLKQSSASKNTESTKTTAA